MFTDIVGYTALMGKDEKKAFELLRKNRDIQKPFIKRFNGIWIKELGDGVLASFHTVTDAVFCAASIHEACDNVDGLQLRIDIHLGEVIFENNSVLAFHNFGTFLLNMGRGNELVKLLWILQIDPLNTLVNQGLGFCYYTLGQYTLSKTQLYETLQIEPPNVLAKIAIPSRKITCLPVPAPLYYMLPQTI